MDRNLEYNPYEAMTHHFDQFLEDLHEALENIGHDPEVIDTFPLHDLHLYYRAGLRPYETARYLVFGD